MLEKIVDLDSALRFAEERGWSVSKDSAVEAYATWRVIQWRRFHEAGADGEEHTALVETLWVTTPTSRKTGLKHGLYVSDMTGRRGEIKAMGGEGHRQYWSLEQALEQA